MNEIVQTKPIREAVRMAQAVKLAHRTGPIGRIIGPPGTGKTECGHFLTQHFGAIRLCGVEGESIGRLGKRLYTKLTGKQPRGTVNDILNDLEDIVRGRMLVMDQADKLGWRQLEWLRYLADEGGLALVLIGTDLLEQKFTDRRTAIYMEQLLSRIGAKTVNFGAFTAIGEFTAYCIAPRFGAVEAKTAQEFMARSKGYWRDAVELGDACQALMDAQGVRSLTLPIVQAAGSWLAPARAIAAA